MPGQPSNTAKRSEVAHRAGVAEGTVSNVITGKARVSPATRERVLAAMEELGYEPSYFARNIRARRTKQVGLIVPDLENPFYAEVAMGAESAAVVQGHTLVLSVSCSEESLADIVSSYASKGIDALILCQSATEKSLTPLSEGRIPAVACGFRPPDHLGMPWVVSDYAGATELTIAYLVGAGHERIALVPGRISPNGGNERLEGWRRALEARGMLPSIVAEGDYSYQHGYDAFEPVMASGATVVVLASDVMASGLLNKALRVGVRVPDAIQVVGYDDTWLAERTYPALTTVRAQNARMGETACRIALEAAVSNEVANVLMPAELVVRASTQRWQ